MIREEHRLNESKELVETYIPYRAHAQSEAVTARGILVFFYICNILYEVLTVTLMEGVVKLR